METRLNPTQSSILMWRSRCSSRRSFLNSRQSLSTTWTLQRHYKSLPKWSQKILSRLDLSKHERKMFLLTLLCPKFAVNAILCHFFESSFSSHWGHSIGRLWCRVGILWRILGSWNVCAFLGAVVFSVAWKTVANAVSLQQNASRKLRDVKRDAEA